MSRKVLILQNTIHLCFMAVLAMLEYDIFTFSLFICLFFAMRLRYPFTPILALVETQVVNSKPKSI